MRPLPLKWRVSILVSVAMIGVVVAILAMSYAETKEMLFSQLDQTLLAMGKGAAAVVDEPGDVASHKSAIDALVGLNHRKHSPVYRVWVEGAADLYTSSSPDQPSPVQLAAHASAPKPGEAVFFNTRAGRGGDNVRAIWFRSESGRGLVNVIIGLPTRGLQAEQQELLGIMIAVGGGAVGGVLALVLLLVVWGLRPIKATARRLLGVTASNVGEVKLDHRSVPSELRPFVTSVSGMLSRLRSAMEQQRAFTADASHELRTPIALAKSTVQLALSQDRSAEQYKEALIETLADLRRMEHLTDELLVLARMDESAGLPNSTEVDMAALLAGLRDQFAALAVKDGGSISLAASPAVVMGDESQLTRLFWNLLDNAFKHGPKDGSVLLAVRQTNEKTVAVSVHDAGGGIPAEALPHLFERFYRADPSRSHSTGGAGLGLAIAREIVLRHGGSIAIASDPQSGTTVTVELPAAAQR